MSKENTKSQLYSDEILLEGIGRGSSEMLDKVYQLFYPTVSNLVKTNGGSESQAKDLFQEVVVVLYNKIKQGNFVLTSKLNTFIYAIAKRLWLKELSKKSNVHHHVDITLYEDQIFSEEELTEHEEKENQYEKMESAIQQLGEPCKTILTDFYIHKKSMTEICEKFGYTNSDNAKTQKYKCLQRLKKLFFSAKKLE